jgi:hypothetical protein
MEVRDAPPRCRFLLKKILLSTLLAGAHAHGSMVMPLARNSIDAEDPRWSDGKHPETGWIEPYNCLCTNGTDTCNNGQSCFWFSNGCTPGCKACDGNGNRYPNFDHCPTEKKADLGQALAKKYWTGDPTWAENSTYDIFKFNPWRYPGKAPVFDSCGMAGGRWTEAFNAAAFNSSAYAKMGDMGSQVLKPRPTGTTWARGGTAKTRWQLTANHGGGYLFRLCPAGSKLDEACFSQTQLAWATGTHVLRFANASRDVEIAATDITEGGGLGWRLNPFPNVRSDPCDYNVTLHDGPGHHCSWMHCPGCGPPTYSADESCPDVCDKHYPGTPDGRAPTLPFPNPTSANMHQFSVEDTVAVPKGIAAGEYVLSWRWDCEHSSQVWNTCADVTIV